MICFRLQKYISDNIVDNNNNNTVENIMLVSAGQINPRFVLSGALEESGHDFGDYGLGEVLEGVPVDEIGMHFYRHLDVIKEL